MCFRRKHALVFIFMNIIRAIKNEKWELKKSQKKKLKKISKFSWFIMRKFINIKTVATHSAIIKKNKKKSARAMKKKENKNTVEIYKKKKNFLI